MTVLAQGSGAAFAITFAHVASLHATCALMHSAHLMFALLLQCQTFSAGRVSQEFWAWVQLRILLFWACRAVSSFSADLDQHLVTRAVRHWPLQNQDLRLLFLTGLPEASALAPQPLTSVLNQIDLHLADDY